MKYGSARAAVAPAATGTPTSPSELETEPSATASIAKEVVERIKRMFKPASTKNKMNTNKLPCKNMFNHLDEIDSTTFVSGEADFVSTL